MSTVMPLALLALGASRLTGALASTLTRLAAARWCSHCPLARLAQLARASVPLPSVQGLTARCSVRPCTSSMRVSRGLFRSAGTPWGARRAAGSAMVSRVIACAATAHHASAARVHALVARPYAKPLFCIIDPSGTITRGSTAYAFHLTKRLPVYRRRAAYKIWFCASRALVGCVCSRTHPRGTRRGGRRRHTRSDNSSPLIVSLSPFFLGSFSLSSTYGAIAPQRRARPRAAHSAYLIVTQIPAVVKRHYSTITLTTSLRRAVSRTGGTAVAPSYHTPHSLSRCFRGITHNTQNTHLTNCISYGTIYMGDAMRLGAPLSVVCWWRIRNMPGTLLMRLPLGVSLSIKKSRRLNASCFFC
jgi:hypothetical protein